MELLSKYNLEVNDNTVKQEVSEIVKKPKSFINREILKQIFSLIDLTSLSVTDTLSSIKYMTEKVNFLQKVFPDMPNVAAICVYPLLVPVVKQNLTAKNIGIASVAAGFPASQTFTDVKTLECSRAAIEGATEIDVVIPVGDFLEKNYQKVFNEIRAEKESINEARLKVILETGCLNSLRDVRIASLIAMEAGADFIKTSTGKTPVSATPEAVYVMCQAIKDYYSVYSRMTGIKPSGGISTPDEAIIYFAIVKEVLGETWLNNKWFRIGASRLANNLLTAISQYENTAKQTIQYF